MFKKCFLTFLCVTLIFPAYSLCVKGASLGISASSAVVMVVQTDEVLYEHNAREKRSMASTTKIMTALLALEKADLKKQITVTEEELKVEGTSMGLLPNDKVTFEGLVYGMLLQSGNDAANVTAVKLGGTVENFIHMMNERADEIGMDDTNFVTPSGLDDDEHYSTAYDMALLGCEAIKNADFRYICSQKKASVLYGNPPYKRTLTNHNKMLSYYDGCIGLKTGFTKKSGRCLVTAAERNGVMLVAVTLNAPNDWNDHKILLDYGFSKVNNRVLDNDTSSLKVSVVGGKKSSVSVVAENKSNYACSENSNGITADILLDCFVYAPVKKGDTVGKIVYYENSKLIAETPVVAKSSVGLKKASKKLSVWQKIIEFIKSIFNIGGKNGG